MKSFLFYDVETSGLNPAFDQILTFACIRTDLSLSEISRELITIQLRRDIVPSPGAFLTHCLTREELAKGLYEYDAAIQIHRIFNTPGTISIGYNSLGFDDEFLRFLFYRNLLDPYSHQYANGCSRMDMLPITAIYKLFCDHVLSWPVLDDGQSTLKLEHLTRENKFETSGRAHEAMSDVEAVLALASAFSGQKKIWDYVCGFFDKAVDNQRINGVEKHFKLQGASFKVGLMVSTSFGSKVNYIAPVVHVGSSLPYKNQSLWIRMDIDQLFEKSEESEIYNLFVLRKRPADQLIVLPALDRFWGRLLPLSVETYQANLAAIQANPELFFNTIEHHRAYEYPEVPDLDVDASLYQSGFFSQREKKEIALFHNHDFGENSTVCDSFDNGRVKVLAQRILSRNQEGGGEVTGEYAAHMRGLIASEPQGQINGYKNDKKYTCAEALKELDDIESSGLDRLEPVQQQIYTWLKTHINRMSGIVTK